MKTLSELLLIESQIDAEISANEGELTPDVELLLNEVMMKKEEKIASICNFMAHLEDRIEANKNREKLYQQRRKSYENLLKNIKNYIKTNMEANDIKKLTSSDFVLSLSNTTPSLEIADNAFIPDEFFKVIKEVDKTKLKDAVKNGLEIEGVWLKQNQALKIKVV